MHKTFLSLLPTFLFIAAASCDSPNTTHSRSESDQGKQNSASAADATPSADDFVRHFYEWYVPVALREHDEHAWYATISRVPPVLGDELLSLLRQDSAAKAAAVGEIVGIDWDPFLASQDPCQRYEVGNVTRRADVRSVTVHADCGIDSNPQILVDVVRRGENWLIRNVRYPGQKSDLITALSELHR